MIRGSLFTRYFLDDGIRQTAEYRSLPGSELEAFATVVRRLWSSFAAAHRPSEAETESEFIIPVLNQLGWHHLPQQEPGRGRRDIADALLFLNDGAKAKARALPRTGVRFRHGVVVVENEARDTLLDRASGQAETPSSQIGRYLGRAETESDGAVRWGLLTNGRFWRLYWAKAPSRAEGFVELELPAALGLEGLSPPVPDGADRLHWARVFLLLFAQPALIPTGADSRTFLDRALDEGRRYEQRVTAGLSAVVFDRVFPDLVRAVAANAPEAAPADPAWRADVRDAGLRLLYRLLFLLYAEDRELMPVRHEGYRPYSLRLMREEAAQRADDARALSPRARTWWPRLAELFRAIAEGDAAMGLPPYNGGLFDHAAAPLLARTSLPDSVLAPLLDAMSREGEPFQRRWINDRDLSVQHLGGIYERLLEQDVVAEGAGVALRPNAFARKTTGSYYTPDELVQLILRRAVGPLIAERRQAFDGKAHALAGDRRAGDERSSSRAPRRPRPPPSPSPPPTSPPSTRTPAPHRVQRRSGWVLARPVSGTQARKADIQAAAGTGRFRFGRFWHQSLKGGRARNQVYLLVADFANDAIRGEQRR